MRSAKLFHLPLLFMVSLFSHNSLAQQPSETTETYGSWTYRCSQVAQQNDANSAAKRACELLQVIRDSKGNVIAQIAFGNSLEDNNNLISVVQVPQGMLLSEPIVLADEVQKNKVAAPYFSCFNNICLARANVSRDVLSALGDSNKGSLEFVDRTGRKIKVLLSFEGLKTASERLVSTSG